MAMDSTTEEKKGVSKKKKRFKKPLKSMVWYRTNHKKIKKIIFTEVCQSMLKPETSKWEDYSRNFMEAASLGILVIFPRN